MTVVKAYDVFERLLARLNLDSFPFNQAAKRHQDKTPRDCSSTNDKNGKGRTTRRKTVHVDTDEDEEAALLEDRDDPSAFVFDCRSPWCCTERWSDEIVDILRDSLASSGRRRPALTETEICARIKSLRLAGYDITVVDSGMRNFPHLRDLILSSNKIEEFPGADHLPPTLEVLDLCHNFVEELTTPLLDDDDDDDGRRTAAAVAAAGIQQFPLLKALMFSKNYLNDSVCSHLTYRSFPVLAHLDLGYNDLSSVQVLVSSVRLLPQLRSLVLVGNPLMLLAGYRGYVVSLLPALRVLDAKMVTWEERRLYSDWTAKGRKFVIDEATLAVEVLGIGFLEPPQLGVSSLHTGETASTTRDKRGPTGAALSFKDEWLYFAEYPVPDPSCNSVDGWFSAGRRGGLPPQQQASAVSPYHSTVMSVEASEADSVVVLAPLLVPPGSNNAQQQNQFLEPILRAGIKMHQTPAMPWSDLIVYEDTFRSSYTNLRLLKKYLESTVYVRVVEIYNQIATPHQATTPAKGSAKGSVMSLGTKSDYFAETPDPFSTKKLKATFSLNCRALTEGECEQAWVWNSSKRKSEAELVTENIRETFAGLKEKMKVPSLKLDKKNVVKKSQMSTIMATAEAPPVAGQPLPPPPGPTMYLTVSVPKQFFSAPVEMTASTPTPTADDSILVCSKTTW